MIVTADDCIQELTQYFTDILVKSGKDELIKIFQYEDKPKTYKGPYIAINALPFVYGFVLNDKNIINLNIHIPSMSDGRFYRTKFKPWRKFICEHLPVEVGYEECKMLTLENASYCIANISQPRKDIDNTHYVNFQLKVIIPN